MTASEDFVLLSERMPEGSQLLRRGAGSTGRSSPACGLPLRFTGPWARL